MQRIPTFLTEGRLLVGTEAKKAWRNQTARCACGSYGIAEEAVSGTLNGMPAEWLGCDNCTGQSLGLPLVYRLPSQLP